MKNKFKIMIIALIAILTTYCTKEFLEFTPKGQAGEEVLSTPENVDKLVIAAYASLGNDHWLEPYTSMWPYGNVRSEDAYKGGLGTSDQGGYHLMETFVNLLPTEDKLNRMWTRIYMGVGRANTALRIMDKLTEEAYPIKVQREAEMRFIRGHFYFLLKELFKNIVIFDEYTTGDALNLISNTEYSNDELWNKIAEDFEFAVNNLPESQNQVGRPNKYVAEAYLAKIRLYQAYEQDEQNNVININQTRLQEVVDLTNDVINSGKYSLHNDYANNYLWAYDNGTESLFAVQRSLNDGSPDGRLDMSTALNYPMYGPYGCCSFHRPSQNLVNAFQTENGIPKFDTYNDVEMKDSAAFKDNTFDPRLDHTVGIPSHPYKYQTDVIYRASSFVRGEPIYGPYSAMKEVQQVDCPCLTKNKGYPYPASSKNNDVIKYDDMLLWKAEALIELNRQDEALPIINEIRERAKNSTGLLKYANGEYVANYNIESYIPGLNIIWDNGNARKALRWERRLEFGMEGVRFFDLVRWGIAEESINEYLAVEVNRFHFLDGAHFTKNKDEYLPIPQIQIDISKQLYQQNYGW